MTPAKSTTVRASAAAKKAPAAKPVTATKPAQPVAKPETPKTRPVKTKPVKVKPVRDSFTFPKNEYLVIDVLKKRAVTLGHPSKKSELLRAGIKALSTMTAAAFTVAIRQVPAIKTGRPGKG